MPGLTEEPCIIADKLTPEQVQTYRIAEWNYALLPMELKDLQNADFNLSVTERNGHTRFRTKPAPDALALFKIEPVE